MRGGTALRSISFPRTTIAVVLVDAALAAPATATPITLGITGTISRIESDCPCDLRCDRGLDCSNAATTGKS